MTKEIKTYKDLLEEKARLKIILGDQKLQVKEDWQSIKEELQPVIHAADTVRNFFTRKATQSALQLGVNLFADGFIKRVLLARAGWVMKFLIPYFIKNYASHVTEEPEKLIHKIRKLFSGKKKHADTVGQETGMDAV
jgi:hypothetical protein